MEIPKQNHPQILRDFAEGKSLEKFFFWRHREWRRGYSSIVSYLKRNYTQTPDAAHETPTLLFILCRYRSNVHELYIILSKLQIPNLCVHVSPVN